MKHINKMYICIHDDFVLISFFHTNGKRKNYYDPLPNSVDRYCKTSLKYAKQITKKVCFDSIRYYLTF